MAKRVPKVTVCRNVRNRVLVALPYSHLSQRKLAGIFRYVCECADWDLNIMSDGSLLTPEAFEIIANEGVDGVIVSADGVESALAEIAKRNIPAALIGLRYFPRTTDVVFVHTDESSIGREAALFFLNRAHWRSYGYVHAQNGCGWDARRARAFSATLSRHAVKCHEFPQTVQSDRSSKALETWLRVLPKPAAVLASDDYCAYKVISACKAAGVRVPTDVSVIGVGNTEVVCENSVPSISSIEPDYDNEGYLAARHLDRIMSAERPVKAEKVSGGVKGVVVRNSASNPKKWAGLLVQKALAYIRANVCRGIGVPDVVAYLHVSRTLADLRFREVLGTTILNTIVDERLERTRNELMDSDESIASVCSRCGWKSENHPKKLFRAKYGQSMRAFRNSIRSGKLRTLGVAVAVLSGALSAMAEVDIENDSFRLTLSESGYATSLVCKETGEECLAKGVKMPFCTLTQYRPYDNENFLIHPAKPTTYPANRIAREGERLVVEFDGTADVAYIAMRTMPDYVGFVLERLDYKIEDFGLKRKTETDEFALVRLPIARRAHFGEWLNVMWDDRTAVTLLGDAPETKIDAFSRGDGVCEFYAGMENRVKLEGCGAVLVAVRKNRLMDVIGAVERDYGMPNGVEARQKIGTLASFYWTKSISPTNADRHIAAAKACGLKYLMINYRAFARTCGHYDFDLKKFPHGLADVKAVTAKIREAGLIPGLHFHYNKVSTNDAYVVDGTPDPRIHGIRDMLLAHPLSAEDDTIYVQGNPAGIVVEPVAASELAARESARHIVQIGDELIRYRRAVFTPPYRLEGCVRGALGTKAVAHTTTERFRHIDVDDWPIFVRIDQDTDLQDEVSERLSAVIRECGFRFYHYDGAEDVPEPYWYNVPRAQTRLRRAIGDMQLWARSAAHVQYSWHSITHGSGFDMFPHERLREAVGRYWSTKAFHNKESFTTTDFGSIDVRWPDEMCRYADGSRHRTTGLQPDHAELAGSKSVAWDGCGGIRIWRDRDLDHPLIDDIFAVMRRWEEVRAAKSVLEDVKLKMRDASREWFIWPFGFDAKHPELVEYRQITSDGERPVRAFSFTRGGKGGIVYWAVGSRTPPELPLSSPGLSVRPDGARRFVEADMGEADLVNCFKDALKRLADAPKMKPVFTVPHELDCLIESGHVQGACCSEQGVYLSHARGLEKIGWDGKLLKHVDAPSHLGDCAYADGKIYGAFVIRDKKVRMDGKRGLVRVWDENLNVLKEAWFDEALDGIVVLGDMVYVGVDRWGKKSHPLCCVKRLDLDLNDLGNTDVDLGYDIAYGVQTMATDGKDLFFGSYGGTSRVSADLKESARIKFGCSEGFGLVPKSIAQSDAKVFFVVHAMGGNMQGWRKDPENNPPRIRLDFFEFKDGNEFKDGKFEDISSAAERTLLKKGT